MNPCTFPDEPMATETDTLSFFRENARSTLLQALLLGTLTTEEIDLFAATEPSLSDATVYQVVLYTDYHFTGNTPKYHFTDLLRAGNQGKLSFYHVAVYGMDVILLVGSYALERFENLLKYYSSDTPPQPGSPLDSLFLTYGKPVKELSALPNSYREATRLMERRFFCESGVHTLGYGRHMERNISRTPTLSRELLTYYTTKLLDCLQTFRRNQIRSLLDEMHDQLSHASETSEQVKMFVLDLHLCIREQIRILYSSSDIPFLDHSDFFIAVRNSSCLTELLDFMMAQFERILRATANPSRNSVMDDVLYYIDHNYSEPLKLETIAPLFGYNSAYFGKFFHRTTGDSFHSYVDHIRIERSKELLATTPLKVYEIAEKVGYHNVDYFHKKFRKYVGISPAEYRKSLAS